MIKLPSDVRHEDVRQWLNDGIFFAKVDNEWELARFVDSDELDNGLPFVSIRTAPDDVRRRVGREDIRVHWPLCGAINYNGRAYYVERRSVRQWGRTFRSSHTYLYTLRRDREHAYMLQEERGRGYTDELLQAVFCPEYPRDLRAAVNSFSRNVYAVALNRHIILSIQEGVVSVLHNTNYVGTINRDTLEFVGDESLVHTSRVVQLLAVSE